MKKLLLKSMLLLCALVVGTSAWAQVASVVPADGGSYVIAAYVNNKYYALPNGAVNGGTITGTVITLNAINKVSTSVATGKIWTLKKGTGTNANFYHIEYTSGNDTYGLYKNGTGGTNYNFAVNKTSRTYWSFTANGTGYTVAAEDRGTTNNVNIQCNSGTFRCYSTATPIILLEVGDAPSGTTAAPTITGNTPFYGSTTATITNAASADGADIYYTLNGSDPTTTTSASCFAYSTPFSIDATTTVKAIAKKSTDTNASSVVSKTFTKVTPMNVASALTAIEALANNGTIADQCVRGIVTKVTSLYNNTAINYTISDDVTGSNELTVYRGKNMHNTDFAALSDIKLGDDVVIYGTLKKYVKNTTTTPQFDEGNYLLYQVSKTAPTFTLSTAAETLTMGTTETVDVTLTTNTDGAITCESDEEDVATVALKSAGVYTITGHMAGTATITIKSALTNHYQPASATVAITVNDTREEAGLSFAEDEEEITWGDAYTGKALTNSHSLPITWSSTDETVATVSSSGVVDVLKAGSTTIKASFDGDATYKKAIVSYTLTINKAAAGLSYTTTSFDIMLNDDTFEAPTLNNPNGLTVTYASNNETVALVDENTGVLAYDETTAGTAKITASFAGNDNYYAGSANYTINIVDPTVKGTKYNPYTVSEIEALSENANGVYVTGYIVGCVTGSNSKAYKTTTGNWNNANLLIADTPDKSFDEGYNIGTTTADGLIPIELPSSPTTLRTNWGISNTSGAVIGYKVILKGNEQAYFTGRGVKSTSEITAVSAPITPAKTYTTLTHKYALDFTSVSSDLKAYIATEVSGGAVQMTQVNKVPAGTGLVLKATTPGAAVNVPVFDGTSPDDVSGNKMAGSATATTAIAENDGYILSNGAFHPATAGTLAAGKAYLNIAYSASAPVLEMNFNESDVTAISEVTNTNRTNNTNVYDLQGRKVAQPTKGLYIVNGKKVIKH